jgi:hypothetical protein
MHPAGWDQEMVTGPKILFLLALYPQPCGTLEQQDPFVMVLVIGRVHRRRLTRRDDPLDPDPLLRKQLGEFLVSRLNRKVVEQIRQRILLEG